MSSLTIGGVDLGQFDKYIGPVATVASAAVACTVSPLTLAVSAAAGAAFSWAADRDMIPAQITDWIPEKAHLFNNADSFMETPRNHGLAMLVVSVAARLLKSAFLATAGVVVTGLQLGSIAYRTAMDFISRSKDDSDEAAEVAVRRVATETADAGDEDFDDGFGFGGDEDGQTVAAVRQGYGFQLGDNAARVETVSEETFSDSSSSSDDEQGGL